MRVTHSCSLGSAFWAVIALFLAVAASPASAAGVPLSLAETLRLAVEQSPELAAQRAMAESATVGVVAAGALPDPRLKTALENVPTNTDERWTSHDPVTMLKVGFIQEFPGATSSSCAPAALSWTRSASR